MYAIYDKVAQVFTEPMILTNDAVAQRITSNCVNNYEHNYYQNPEDYELWKIGTFDDNEGEIVRDRKKIVDAVTLKRHEGADLTQ